MELGGLEPPTSWVRSRQSRGVSWALFAGDFFAAGAREAPRIDRSLREIAGVPSGGRPEVMKLIGRLRLLCAVEAERGEIGPGVDSVPRSAAEAGAEQRTDRVRAVRDHWDIAPLEMLGEPQRRSFAAPAAQIG